MSDEQPKQLFVNLPKTLHDAVKAHCVAAGVSMRQFTVEAIEAGMRRGLRVKPARRTHARAVKKAARKAEVERITAQPRVPRVIEAQVPPPPPGVR